MLLPGRFGEAARYLPANLMQSVLQHSWTPPALMEEISPSLLGSSQAALGIAIWTLALFGLALWIFRRQHFSG